HPDFVTAILAGVAARAARTVTDVRDLSRLAAQLHWALTHPEGYLGEVRHQVADLRGRHDDLHRFTLGVHQLALELQRFGGELHRADQNAYAVRLYLEGRLAEAEASIAELSRQVREQG